MERVWLMPAIIISDELKEQKDEHSAEEIVNRLIKKRFSILSVRQTAKTDSMRSNCRTSKSGRPLKFSSRRAYRRKPTVPWI
jgi:hypothetical protein